MRAGAASPPCAAKARFSLAKGRAGLPGEARRAFHELSRLQADGHITFTRKHFTLHKLNRAS